MVLRRAAAAPEPVAAHTPRNNKGHSDALICNKIVSVIRYKGELCDKFTSGGMMCYTCVYICMSAKLVYRKYKVKSA